MLETKFRTTFDAISPDELLLSRTHVAMQEALCAPRRPRWAVPAAIAGACALLLCTFLPLSGQTAAPSSTQLQAIIQTPLAPGEHQPTVQLTDGLLIFNEQSSQVDAARLYYDPDTTRTERWSQPRILQYLGRDVRPARLPDDLLYRAGREDDSREVIVDLEGTPLHAVFSYDYSNVPLNTFDAYARELCIQVQRDRVPFQCGLYLPDAQTVSRVGTLEITVAHARMPQGPFEPRGVPSGYTDIYFASFVRDGLGYYVRSECLSQAEFIDVLLQLVLL